MKELYTIMTEDQFVWFNGENGLYELGTKKEFQSILSRSKDKKAYSLILKLQESNSKLIQKTASALNSEIIQNPRPSY